jgi:quercetin dioxygenase-like cupin family protein
MGFLPERWAEMTTAAKSVREITTVVLPHESRSTTWVMGAHNLCKARKEDTNGAFSMFVTTVEPHEGVPNHIHLVEDEFYYTIDGQWEIYDLTNDVTQVIGPDTYVYIPKGILHGFKNISDQKARMILVITPGGLEGFFEGIGVVQDRVDEPRPQMTGPYDFEKAAQVAARFNVTFEKPREDGVTR